MDPLQRTAGPAPTGSSQDPPRIRRSERNSPVKNRMRETCTSGSVRGGDGDIPTYSALGAAQRRERGVEGALLGKGRDIAEQGQSAGRMKGRDPFEEEAAEQA